MTGAGVGVFAVWGYVIAHCVDGQVELNPRVVASMIGTTEDEVIKAIAFLEAPDPNSRSKEEEGRRLLREGMFAYRVVNHAAYRRVRDETDRREYNRTKKAEGRARGVNVRVKESIRESIMSAQAEAETDTKAETRTAVRAKPYTSWLAPICDVYERHYGAGSFPYAQAGKLLKPLHEAGHSGEEIASRLDRYANRLDDIKYLSLAKFKQTFGAYATDAVRKPQGKPNAGEQTYRNAIEALDD